VPLFLIDERIKDDGTRVRTHLAADAEHVRVIGDDGVAGMVTHGVIVRLMQHYGKPLDPAVAAQGDSIDLAGGRLVRMRYHARVDAEARDWLVWHAPDREPIAVLSTKIAAALRYLILRLDAERAGS
jgi:hypothetical protein